MARHELWLTNDRGERLELIDNFTFFEASRIANAVGMCWLTLPSTFDTSLLRIDRMLQLWRAPPNGALSLWRPYLIQRIRYEMSGEVETILVGGADCNHLLTRRLVVAATGSDESEFSDFADDIMKTLVDEAMVNSTYTTQFGTRDYTDFTVQRDLSDAPTLSYVAAYENLRDALKDLSRRSREYGTDLFFDVVPTFVTGNSISFEFRTYTNQIGADLSDRVVFDQNRGNFKNPYYERDWSDVQSYIYAAGQGTQSVRRVYECYDKARLYISKWGWREGYKSASGANDDNALIAAGYEHLEKGRPVRSFGGQPFDTDATQYVRDWNFGDIVRGRYRDIDVEAMIDAVTLTIEERRETIEAHFRLVDFGDVVVHVLSSEMREFYALEELWKEAQTIVHIQ